MSGVPLWQVLFFSSVIFMTGLIGVVLRRNVLVLFMCIELMLNSVNLTFIAFSRALGDLHGQIAVFFIMVVAAAEIAVGLGLVIAMFRTLRSVDTDDIRMLRE